MEALDDDSTAKRKIINHLFYLALEKFTSDVFSVLLSYGWRWMMSFHQNNQAFERNIQQHQHNLCNFSSTLASNFFSKQQHSSSNVSHHYSHEIRNQDFLSSFSRSCLLVNKALMHTYVFFPAIWISCSDWYSFYYLWIAIVYWIQFPIAIEKSKTKWTRSLWSFCPCCSGRKCGGCPRNLFFCSVWKNDDHLNGNKFERGQLLVK